MREFNYIAPVREFPRVFYQYQNDSVTHAINSFRQWRRSRALRVNEFIYRYDRSCNF